MTSGDGTRGDEVVQGQRIQGPKGAARTFDCLVDDFGQGIGHVGIVSGGPSVLDVVLGLELLEPLGTGIVDVLSIGDERRRRRSVGGRHFEWRTG